MYNSTSWLYDFDARHWYIGGKCWLAGESPYDAAVFSDTWVRELGKQTKLPYDTAFVYPPTLLLIGVPLACLSWDAACLALRSTSLLAFFGICYFAMRMIIALVPRGWKCREMWVYAGCCCLLYTVKQPIYQGQISLIVACGMTAMLYAAKRQWKSMFIAGFVVASIKPQITLLVLLFVFFSGAYWPGILGAFFVGLLSFGFVSVIPHEFLLQHVRESLHIHMSQQFFNQFKYYNSLPALLGSTFLSRGAFVGGIVAGCLAVAGLGVLVRKQVFSHLRNPAVRMLQIVYALSIALLPIHRYDTVLYVPFLISLVIVQGTLRKLLLTSIVVLHGGIWKSEPIRLFAKYVLGLPAEQLDPFVKQYHWDIANYTASIVPGVVLLLVLVYLWQDLRQAQAGRKQT